MYLLTFTSSYEPIFTVFIYITREAFVRHTALRNFKMLDDTRDQNLRIPLVFMLYQNRYGKNRQKKT